MRQENDQVAFHYEENDNIQECLNYLKRLGAKLSDGQFATAGSIIYRQRGTKVHPGNNVGIGKDDTLFCMIDGIVKYERLGKDKTKASVYSK